MQAAMKDSFTIQTYGRPSAAAPVLPRGAPLTVAALAADVLVLTVGLTVAPVAPVDVGDLEETVVHRTVRVHPARGARVVAGLVVGQAHPCRTTQVAVGLMYT